MFKTMGDGFLVEFPSVVAAVDCALAMQARDGACATRLCPSQGGSVIASGINLGDVLVEGDDLVGDGVNIAARLEGIAPPGGICISGTAYENVRGTARRRAYSTSARRALKNIARPVRVYACRPRRIGRATRCATAGSRRRRRISLVVLPFANLGGGREQEYFVDGVTESLTTDLSRISGAFVIARNTAFAYRGQGDRRARRSAAISMCAMCLRAAFSAAANACASTCS